MNAIMKKPHLIDKIYIIIKKVDAIILDKISRNMLEHIGDIDSFLLTFDE